MLVEFTHPETKAKYRIETDKKFILIYGKNGSGKTTLTRNDTFQKNLVFNEDFVNENIYTISESGATLSSNNKKNFSKLWIGHDIVAKSKELEELNNSTKHNREFLESIRNIVVGELNKASVNSTLDAKEFALDDFDVVMNDLEENAKNFVYKVKKDTDIKDDTDLDQQVISIKNDKLLSMLHENIKRSELLNDIFFCSNSNKVIENMNSLIYEIKESSEILSKIDEELKLKNVYSEEIKKHITTWIELHEYRSSCLFCGNEDITKALHEWKEIIESKEIVKRTQLIIIIDRYISDTNVILNQKDNYYEIEKETIEKIEDISKLLIKIKSDILSNIFTNFLVSTDGVSSELKGIAEKMLIVRNYIINKHINVLVFYASNDQKLNEARDRVKNELGNLMDLNGSRYAKGINDTLISLGLNKAIDFSVNKRTTPFSYEFKLIENREIKTLSDGQKHKLALAMFLYSLKEKDYKNQTIVIDDPVVSLDVLSYHQVRSFLIKNLISTFKDNGDVKLIILTHNINYLYIQLSSIFEDKSMNEITEVYRMGISKIDKVDIDLLKTDDITLFKVFLNHVSGVNGFRLLPCLILKMFRQMVDIRLRFNGISATEGVGIGMLNTSDENRKKLQKISNYLSKEFKIEMDHDDKSILEAIYKLKLSAEILGFGELLSSKDVEKLEKIVLEKPENDILEHPCFDILQQVNNFFRTSEDHDLKEYVRHPRNSYTKNMVTLCLNNDI